MSWLRQRRRGLSLVESGPASGHKNEEPRVKTLLAQHSRSLFVVLISWLALALYISSSFHEELPSSASSITPTAAGALHFLIPASSRSPDLCKAIISSSVAGYPGPTLLNWEEESESVRSNADSADLAKITGVRDYLTSLDSIHDEDLVIVMDGYNSWLQLRAQTLLDRYYSINRRADARRANRLGLSAPDEMRQEVLFGSQKRCWPQTEKDPACYAVPESDLPVKVYGPDTDKLLDKDDTHPNPHIRVRPRYLNSGFIIGPARAMRKLFAQAAVRMEQESNVDSDQDLFSRIYGDQEVWREVARRRSQSWFARTWARWQGAAASSWPTPTAEHMLAVESKASEQEDGSYEFGIGIDFRSELVFNTVFAEDETTWLTSSKLSPSDLIQKTQASSKASAAAVLGSLNLTRFSAPPADVAAALPPFWTFSHEPELTRWQAWRDVPLFTDLWTGAVPAVILHHQDDVGDDADRSSSTALREAGWNETWFFPHLRALYDASVFAPVIPLARSGRDDHSLTDWWPLERYKGGARGNRPDGPWLTYESMCNDYHEDIFRDGRGPWILPESH